MQMISLYFNCRITGKNLIPNSVVSGFFYPVIYPKNSQASSYSQAEVLLEVIKSYSSIEFDVAIFNISLDSDDDELCKNIDRTIHAYIKANRIVVVFARPSTIEEWRGDLVKASQLIKANTPVLVAMNHDHLFVDYTPAIFNQAVESIFPESEDNFGKALVYSHTPESMAELVNNRFCQSIDGLLYKQKASKHLSSILVMTMETLESYISKVKKTNGYIGRLIDWPNVFYGMFTLKVFYFPREFFRHFDGYGHITGLRSMVDLRQDIGRVEFPDPSFGLTKLVDFYYAQWLNCFLIYMRDAFSLGRNLGKDEKAAFIGAIENSLTLFQRGYIDSDCQSGILPEQWKRPLEDALRGHVYYHANELHAMLANEIILMRTSKARQFYKSLIIKIQHLIPFKFINQYKLLYQLNRERNKK